MDLIVIVLGLAAFVPSSNNFQVRMESVQHPLLAGGHGKDRAFDGWCRPNAQVLRTLRLLRPLASVSTSMSMRVLIKSLIGSLARLVGVLMLCSFLYVLYGIIGLEIWMGLFRGHCVNVDTGEVQDLNVVCGECEDGFECRVSYFEP